MSPVEARVFVAEDERYLRDYLIKKIEEAGHYVVATAATRQEALATIPKFRELGVQVASLDGNLGEFNMGADGQAIQAAIRQQTPEVKTIGVSGVNFPNADVDLGKGNISQIGEVITRL